MQKIFLVPTTAREKMHDITNTVQKIVDQADKSAELVHVFVSHTTAAIVIQEATLQHDLLYFLNKLVPQGIWKHDRCDGNGDAHIKATLFGPGQIIPVTNGKLSLGQWQRIFLCEFDGPRKRQVKVTVY